MKEKACGWHRFLTLCGILALLAAIAYGVYYFFFAEDEEELEDDFFETETQVPTEEGPGEAAPASA